MLRRLLVTIGLALLATLFALLLLPFLGNRAQAQAPPRVVLGASSHDLAALAARVSGAVVQVAGVGARGAWTGADGSLGSGFVVDTAGHVVTNAHVVRGARRLTVLLAGSGDGARVRRVRAQVVGADEETDVALLRLELPAGAARPPALALARERVPRAGELVMAVGSPFGLKNSVSLGVVSATERQLDPERHAVFLQTDAPINPGSSGGPLVAMDGRVVGMSTAIVSQSGGSEGLGFAVPADVLHLVVAQLRAHGRVRRGEVGITAQSITPVLAAALRLERDWGAILADVDPEGPAKRAGLDVGDIVTAVDGRPVSEAWQLEAAVAAHAIGDTLRLTAHRVESRGGTLAERTLEARVAVVERPDAPDWLARVADPERSALPELGIVGLDLPPDDASVAPLLAGRRVRAGVLVAETSREEAAASQALAFGDVRPAAQAPVEAFGAPRFARGDIIHWLDGHAVHRVDELRAIVGRAAPGTAMLAHVDRGGRLLFVAFERP